MRTLRPLLLVGGFAGAIAISCSDDGSSEGSGANSGGTASTSSSAQTAQGGSGSTGTITGASGNTTGVGTYSAGVGGAPTTEAECQGHVYQCGDIIDNDGDGLIDYQDPDCLGPCDNTEDSYFGGIPGQSGPPCKVDCYFDQDSGTGNDDCYWDHICDPHEVAPDYYPEPWLGAQCEYAGPDEVITPVMKTCEELDATQSQACHDYCGPLTPNGCDCFGCCELPAGSGSYVWLGSIGPNENTVCTQAEVGNPDVCHPCDPVAACLNDCDPCEICIGKPLPGPECFGEGGGGQGGNGAGGGPGSQCDPGIQACGLQGQAPCPPGFYCITGCCQAEPD